MTLQLSAPPTPPIDLTSVLLIKREPAEEADTYRFRVVHENGTEEVSDCFTKEDADAIQKSLWDRGYLNDHGYMYLEKDVSAVGMFFIFSSLTELGLCSTQLLSNGLLRGK